MTDVLFIASMDETTDTSVPKITRGTFASNFVTTTGNKPTNNINFLFHTPLKSWYEFNYSPFSDG